MMPETRFLYDVGDDPQALRDAGDHGFGCYVTIMEAAHFRAGGRYSDYEVMDKIMEDLGPTSEIHDPSRLLTEVAAGCFTSMIEPDALRRLLDSTGTFAEAELLGR